MYTIFLDYSPRHCWDNNCDKVKGDALHHGQTEFLRWIREFGVLAPGIVTGFEDGWLKLGNDVTENGDTMYCENYGGRVKAFLNTREGYARVEFPDDSLKDFARKALFMVEGQYKEMEDAD